jgi:hypothetical protein
MLEKLKSTWWWHNVEQSKSLSEYDVEREVGKEDILQVEIKAQ